MTLVVRQATRPLLTVKANGSHISSALDGALVRVVIDHSLGRPETFLLSFREPAGHAAEAGYILRADGRKLHFGPPPAPASAPAGQGFKATNPLELTWGDNLLRLAAAVRSDAQVKEVVVRSWDPQKKEALVGKVAAASALVELA